MSNITTKATGLARRLIDNHYIGEATAITLTQEAAQQQLSFVSMVITKRVVPARVIATLVAQDVGLPLLDLHAFDTQQLPTLSSQEPLMRQYRAIPLFKRGGMLFIALSDPSQLPALSAFTFSTGLPCQGVIVEDDKLTQLLDKQRSRQTADSLTTLTHTAISVTAENPIGKSTDINQVSAVDDTPVVRFINQLLQDAIKQGISDIHFEPYEHSYRIRFRHDSILYEAATPPPHLATRITARIKVMSGLDISERRLPQDGHFEHSATGQQPIHFRVNTCPTVAGEKVVIRVLDPSKLMLGIEALGYDNFQRTLFVNMLYRPQGMMLVTGPTGSGKTVSLYTGLSLLNTPERNIITIEDPVEIAVPGINQVQVHAKTGLTFSRALRAFLRQDPDVIMVGEIRDLETADIAMKAAQTGHLVLSTLHTNSATETLTRLVHMGVAPFLVATSVNLIIAQRLTRRLCQSCRLQDHRPAAMLISLGLTETQAKDTVFYKANHHGCEHCKHGFHGRVGIYEMLVISEAIGELMIAGAHATMIEKQAVAEGMQTLRLSGIKKVLAGMTSLEEVIRVTKV